MSSVAEHLKRLQYQYLPFLNRTLERLANLQNTTERDKVKVFVDLLSSDVQTIQGLHSDTLKKCETVCKSLYSRYGREDENHYHQLTSINERPYSDRPSLAHPNNRNRFETPRPVAQIKNETPKSPSPQRHERIRDYAPTGRGYFDLKSVHYSTPSTPTLNSSSNQFVRSEPSPGLLGKTTPVLQTTFPSIPQRESRFDRYSSFSTNISPSLPQDVHSQHVNISPKRTSRWDVKPEEVDSLFNRNSTRASHLLEQLPPINQTPGSSWNLQPVVPHPPSPAWSNPIPSPMPYSRVGQGQNLLEQHSLPPPNLGQSWSNKGLSTYHSSHFPSENVPSFSGMHPTQLFSNQPMVSTKHSPTFYPQPTHLVPNTSNISPEQPSQKSAASVVRREDHRGRNISTKSGPAKSGYTSRPSSDYSSNSGASRHYNQKDSQRRTFKSPSESAKGSHKEYRREESKTSSYSSRDQARREEGKSSKSRSSNARDSPVGARCSSSRNSESRREVGELPKSYKIPKRHSIDSSKESTSRTGKEKSGGSTRTGFVADSNITLSPGVQEPNLVNDTSSKDDLSHIPLDLVESCLKRAMPPSQEVKLIDKIKTGVTIKDDSLSFQAESGNKPDNALRDLGRRPDRDVNDSTVLPSDDVLKRSKGPTYSSSTVDLAPASATASVEDTPLPGSDGRTAVNKLKQPNREKKSTRSRPRTKTSLILSELERLHEDIPDHMKLLDTGRARRRTRPSQPLVFEGSSDENDGGGEKLDSTYVAPLPSKQSQANTGKGKRGKKKTLSPSYPLEVDLTEDSDANEQQPMGLEAQNSSSATEPSLTLKSTSHQRVQVRKKKNQIQPSLNPAPEAEAPKSKKRKKDSNKKAPENVEAPADKCFQCRNCPYSGQKIVRHYVTKHPGLEIPFATVPSSKWVALSSNVSFENSSRHHPVNSDLFADLSWIPTQSNLKSELTHCKLCPYSSCIPSELKEHFILHALPVNCHYRCHLCDHREANFFDILDHVTGHTGEYRYRCSHCDFRVDSRTGIKQHMNTHHASEDVFDYSTSLPNVKQPWIFGFVCINCHFVQMDFEQLERHVKNNTSCSSYFKVSMISTVYDNSMFWSDTPEKRENLENSDSFILKKLRGHRSSTTCIQNLVEKLSTVEAHGNSLIKEEPHSDEPSFISQLESPNEARMVVASIPRRSLSPEQGLSSGVAPGVSDVRLSLKPNTMHDSTVSKLVEKVGNLSSSLPEELFDEDSSYCESPVSYDDDDDMESCSTETEEVVDGRNISIKQEDVELEIKVKTETCVKEDTGYLQIENVISFVTIDDDDCLDPIQSDILVSNVTIRKGEITFPFPIAHDRPALASQLKDKQSYLSMMQRDRVRNFYKCMAHRCMFSSQSAKDFKNHLNWHYKQYLNPNLVSSISQRQMIGKSAEGIDDSEETLTVPDFCLCSYCPASFEVPENLVSHVYYAHGESTSQCSSCFFRARLPKMVAVHAIVAHNGAAYALDCQRAIPEEHLQFIDPHQIGILDIPRYLCNVPDCLFTCIHRSSFVAHMSTSHPGRRDSECRECKQIITCSSSNYTELFLHMNKHGIGFFHCAYCQYGTDLSTDILLHLCLVHPSLLGKTLIRAPPNEEGDDSSKLLKLIKFWTERLPHSYSRTHVIDLDGKFRELFVQILVFESSVGLGEDIFDGSAAIKSPVRAQIESTSVQDADKAIENGSDHQINQLEQSESQVTERIGDEESKANEESSVCIVIDEGAEDGNLVDVPTEQIAQQEDPRPLAGEDKEKKLVDLSARELYMCGNLGCDETADSLNAFKEHLMVCDLARDSRVLTCRHCGNNFKLVSTLADHLTRVHGVKRFLCSLCCFRAVQSEPVKKHMKTDHRITDVVEVAIGPGSALPENTLYSLYPREIAVQLKSNRTKAVSKARTISCNDAGSIPMKSTLPYTVKCAHCCYTSKVKTNLLRHLSLHILRSESANVNSVEGEELIPHIVVSDKAPMNPWISVPHMSSLPSSLSDRMANSAYNSHATRKRKRDVSDQSTNERLAADPFSLTSSSFSLPPVFVPDEQRFVCGFNRCDRVPFKENDLKNHLKRHKKFLFSCPHCEDETGNELSLEDFNKHLKMHGPKLFKCGHCDFYHWLLSEIDSHLTEKHPNRTPCQIVIREPVEAEDKRLQNPTPGMNAVGLQKLLWHCCLCKFEAACKEGVSTHAETVHGVKSQFKCALCPVRCSIRSEFHLHFAACHPEKEMEVMTLFCRVESNEDYKQTVSEIQESVVIQPLWKRNSRFRRRRIRGILLEENEVHVSSDTD